MVAKSVNLLEWEKKKKEIWLFMMRNSRLHHAHDVTQVLAEVKLYVTSFFFLLNFVKVNQKSMMRSFDPTADPMRDYIYNLLWFRKSEDPFGFYIEDAQLLLGHDLNPVKWL